MQHVDSGPEHGIGKRQSHCAGSATLKRPQRPLNFPSSKKLLIFAVTGLGTTIWGATIPPLLNASLADIAVDLNIPLTKAVLAIGYQPLVVESSIMLVNAFPRRWGKRPVFLASGLVGLIGTTVGAAAKNYQMLVVARLVQGLSSSAYESLVLSIIGDLFFIHQRGLYTAIMTFLLASVSKFSSTISGPVTAHFGWRYLFNLAILFGGLQIILHFLFVPETQYRRDHSYDIDEAGMAEIPTTAIVHSALTILRATSGRE